MSDSHTIQTETIAVNESQKRRLRAAAQDRVAYWRERGRKKHLSTYFKPLSRRVARNFKTGCGYTPHDVVRVARGLRKQANIKHRSKLRIKYRGHKRGIACYTRTTKDRVMQYAQIDWKEAERRPEALVNEFAGFMWSQKMDGWNVTWDGRKTLYTKGGFALSAPATFLAHLPQGTALAGELVLAGEDATSVARLRRKDGPWHKARFYAFDMPANVEDTFEDRYKKLKSIVESSGQEEEAKTSPYWATTYAMVYGRGHYNPSWLNGEQRRGGVLRYVTQRVVPAKEQYEEFMRELHDIRDCTGVYSTKYGQCRGEGIVLTHPKSLYKPGKAARHVRAKLKFKSDAEAVVVGHNGSRSLRVRMPSGKQFNLGVGLNNAQRRSLARHFPSNTVVKYSYRSLNKNGIPLGPPALIGIRDTHDM